MTGTPAAQRITFVSCVEHGTLEAGTIRLVESLRRFGGELADSPFVAVTPRRGPSLQPSTLRRFAELGVEYVRTAPRNRYAWMPYLNKYFALCEGEQRAQGDLVAWLDSDVLVLKPPLELLLDADVDFAACPRDKNVGTGGAGDEFDGYWQKVCSDVGLEPDDLPWVRTATEGERIRLYWNAGIFVYRPASGFIHDWRKVIETILDRTDESTLDKMFWVDQVALGLTAVLNGTRVRHLPGALNYGIATHFKDHLTDRGLATAALLHYHDAMTEANWNWFLNWIEGPLPEVHAWLARLGPIQESSNAIRQVTKNGFKAVRQVRRRLWTRSHGAGVLGR